MRRLRSWRQHVSTPAWVAGTAAVVIGAITAAAAAGGSAPKAEPIPTSADTRFFEQKIRPVLVERCYSCHSASTTKPGGGLLLDTRDASRKGGDRGPSIIVGNPEKSLLIRAIHYNDPDLQMPPKEQGGKLPAAVIADFEKWVRSGAADPRTGTAASVTKAWDPEKAKSHWAYQPLRKTSPPAVKDAAWPRSEIDRYLLADMEAKGLKPVGDADARTLLRRVTFDLTGLPPTPEETQAFLLDLGNAKSAPGRESAYEKVVERLLASPRYGERWGRHWLDVARYAESSGKEVNFAYPHAWRYRDYVIDAFNQDRPYDQFIREQVAGDLLPHADERQHARQLIATGYLAIGPKSHNTRDGRQFAYDLADEQIDAVSQGVLGVTVACARCHDHKFDPFTQKDYYALAGIFLSTQTLYGTPRSIQNAQATALIELPAGSGVTPAPSLPPFQLANLRQRYSDLVKERQEILAEARRTGQRPMADPRLLRTIVVGSTLEGIVSRYDDDGNQRQYAMGAREGFYMRDAAVLQRGELDKPLDVVPRGFLPVLSTGAQPSIQRGSGRKELAEWLTSRSNPLTARVMANRVWLHLFGRGLVATPDNFGVMGDRPTHPALLDHLALGFMEDGWSVKKLVRRIVLSRAYQLSSAHSAADYALDPDNVHQWRMSHRPLEAEAVRDAMLSAGGVLNFQPPAGSPISNIEGPAQQMLQRPGLMMAGEQPIRSVYLPVVRDQVSESLTTFDFPGSSLVTGNRESTTVPGQALYLMNNASVQRAADAMAFRLIREGKSTDERVALAFQLAFGRPPSATEKSAAGSFFDRFAKAEAARHSDPEQLTRAAFGAFCQALFASAEFRYLD